MGMFETRSTPCLRQPSPLRAASAQKSKGGLAAMAASSSMSKIMPGKAVVDGSSLFTPRPKVLHRSQSEVMQNQQQIAQFSYKSEASGKAKWQALATNASDQGSRAAPGACSSLVHALAPGTILQNQRAQSCERSESRSMRIEVCETVAVGSQRHEATKLKSSKTATAEQEPKGRELRERQQDTSSTSIRECVRAKVRPLVPEFKPDPVMRLRQIELKPKVAEDNYEISEPEGDSDEDAEKSRDRGSKHVPKWCGSYLEDLEQQSDVDPDTIFSSKVSRCDLDAVFTDTVYREVGKLRPKRLRGSSGDWRKDRLTCLEIKSYKSRMGHLRSWDEERVDNKEPASVR